MIYYRQGSRMMAVDFRAHDGAPDLSRPRLLSDRSYVFGANLTIPNYDVSRLLLIKNQGSTSHLSLMLNWPELLRSLQGE